MDSMVALEESLIPDGSNIEVLEINEQEGYTSRWRSLHFDSWPAQPLSFIHKGKADFCRTACRTTMIIQEASWICSTCVSDL